MPPQTRNDSFTEERRAAGMTDEEIAYMRSGGRGDLPGASDDDRGSGAGDGGERTGDTSSGAEAGDDDQQQVQQGQQDQQRVDDEGEDDITINTPVPYQKFRREKKRLQDRLAQRDQELARLNGTVSDFNTRFARLDERLRIFREAAEAQEAETGGGEAETVEVPDPDTDPIGYMKWLGNQLEQGREEFAQTRETVQESRQNEAMKTAYVADAHAFSAQQPAFPEAYRWLIAMRNNQLIAAGIDDPSEREQLILQDERDLVSRAYRDRQNNPSARGPAQRVYEYAVASGFRPAQRQPAPRQQQNGARQQEGLLPDNRGRQAPVRQNVGDMIDNIERGRSASRSLSGTGGSSPRAGLNLDELINMSDEEYMDWVRALTPGQRREYQQMLGAPERASLR